jgi:hypothetical protein
MTTSGADLILETPEPAEEEEPCRGCGADHETIDARVLKVRREAGLE